MPRGGFRPGAGRPKGSGSKDKKPSGSAPKKSVSKKRPAGKKSAKAAASPKVESVLIPAGTAATEPLTGEHIPAVQDPLSYMLGVMNNPKAEPDRRDRMAIAAAPFVHGKVGEAGKKQARADAARAAGGGRFAPAPPPPRSPGRVN